MQKSKAGYKFVKFEFGKEQEIPEDWLIQSIEDLGEIITGTTPSTSDKHNYGGDFPWATPPDLGLKKYVVDTQSKLSEKGFKLTRPIPTGSIMVTCIGIIGRIGIAAKRMATNQQINSIICKKHVPNFVYYQLLFNQQKIRNVANQSVVPILNKSDFGTIKIILPRNPAEQERIVSILSKVDDLIQKTDEIIEQTQRLKKGLMQGLLTKGIGHKDFRHTEIGNIPSEWKLEKLGNTLELCQYGLSMPMTEKGRYSIIRMNEISDGYIIPNIAKFVNIDDATFNKFKLEKGDVLVNRTNSYELVGRTGIFTLSGDYIFASYIIRLRPKREVIEPLFLSLYLIFANERLRRIATRAVHQANINATNLKDFLIPIPDIEEQKKIVGIMSLIENEGKLIQQYKSLLEKLKKGLMQKLLTGKIRVKV